MVETIYEDEHISCAFQDGAKTDVLIITFGGMFARPGERPSVWSGHPLRKIGYPAFGFIAKAQNWYPATSILNAVEMVKAHPYFDIPERVGYGFSMGAYAVLKYGSLLNLSRAVSLSPQFSIDRHDIVDPRFNRHFKDALNSEMRIAQGDFDGRAYLIVDPHEKRDYEHALMIQDCLSAEILKAPHIGHASVNAFQSTDVLADILSCSLGHDVDGLNKIVQNRRIHAPHRPMNIARRLTRTHRNWAWDIFRRYRDQFPEKHLHLFLNSVSSPEILEGVIAEMKRLYPTQKGHAPFLSTYSAILTRAGDLGLAEEMTQEASRIKTP